MGNRQDERLVIINADDLGITESTNRAITKMFQTNAITSASLMVPCIKAQEAAHLCKRIEGAGIGIHLTLTSSEQHFHKPVYQKRKLKSLVTEEGFFPHDAMRIEQSAEPEEVRMELEAQIETALTYGIDPTHLDSHAGSILGLSSGRDFLEVVFDLCEKYNLPFNLPLRILEQPFFSGSQKEMFASRIESAKKRGIPLIDDLAWLPYHSADPEEEYGDLVKELTEIIRNIKHGITQITTHPSIATDELKTLTPHYRKREMEFRLFNDPFIKELFENERIKLISWKGVRDRQRMLNRQ